MDNNRIVGEQLIGTFYKLLMSVRFHDEKNASVISASEDLLDLFNFFFSRGETYLTIKIKNNRFFFQEEKLSFRKENEADFVNALQYFEERAIAEIRFLPTEEKITPQVLHKIALFLYHSNHTNDPVQWLKKRLANEAIHWFDVDALPVAYTYGDTGEDFEIREDTDEYEPVFDREMESAKKIYAYALDTIKRVAQKVAGPNVTGMRNIQRTVQTMVDSIIEDDSVLLAMSTIRDSDDYVYCHSVNVSILAMCFGLHIGLSKKSVEILGICGLLHDLGKADIPVEIIRKAEKLSHDESMLIEKHSLFSVTKILKMKTGRDLKASILRSPLEHHIKFDRSGYPKLKMNTKLSFFGRILTIVDVFEALTSPRAYRPIVYSPDQAIGKMLQDSGTHFDPLLLKAFVNMMGVYPMGTLLQLDTGEMGLVIGKGKGPLGNRPDVVVIKSDGDNGYIKGEEISLEQRDKNTLAYIRNIVASFHPSQFGIQPAQFILE